MGGSQTKAYSLPKGRLEKFLRTTLELSESDMELMETDKYQFLCALIRAYDCHLPFQNLSHCTVPFKERNTPTLQDNIDAVLAQQGGRCWTLNSVMHVLLKELGYNVTPLLGSVAMPGANNHMSNLVRDVKEAGDSYLVDVGFSCTAHVPIALDFEDTSPEYAYGYQCLRFARRDGKLVRQERVQEDLGPKFPTQDGDWDNVIFIDVDTPVDLATIEKNIEKAMYADPKSKFNVTRRITGTNAESKRFVAIYDERLFVEGEDGKLSKSALGSEEELLESAAKYFPYFPQDIVKKAYEVWRQYDRQEQQ